jgi:hypothetical protein
VPIYRLEDIEEEFVTPKHSAGFGRLITGEQIESACCATRLAREPRATRTRMSRLLSS